MTPTSIQQKERVVFDSGRTIRIERQIAVGGFSTVFQVRMENTNNGKHKDGASRSYALKGISIQDQDELDVCRKEAKVHRECQHKNLMPLLDIQFRSTDCYMLFPYFDNSLTKELYKRRLLDDTLESERSPLSESQVLNLMTGISSGVQALHQNGWSHGDIKVDNIMLDENFDPILMDFGSAGPVTIHLKTPIDLGNVIEKASRNATTAYKAPELWPEAELLEVGSTLECSLCDVWSMGCVFFAILYGASPIEIRWSISLVEGHEADATARIIDCTLENVLEPPPFPPEGSASDLRYCNSKFRNLIEWMLNIDQSKRPDSKEVVEKLSQYQQGRRETKSKSSIAQIRKRKLSSTAA